MTGGTIGVMADVPVELVDPGTLVPWPGNPRRADMDAIRRSIRERGFFGAVVARPSDRRILAGNHRARAAIDVGIEEVLVRWHECSDEEAAVIVAADNRTSDLATWDEAGLRDLLSAPGEAAAEARAALEAVGQVQDPPASGPVRSEGEGPPCPRCGAEGVEVV